MNLRKFVLMDGTPGAGGGGAPSGGAGGSGDGGAPAGGDGGAAGGGQPAGGADAGGEGNPSLLANAMANQTPDFIPEKFRVMTGDKLDIEASARKLAESYAGLEKRVGSGDIPPKTAEEYTVNVPEAMKEHWQQDERFKNFQAEAHKAGLNQAQFQFMMDTYFRIAPELAQGGVVASAQEAEQALRGVWKTDDEYKANMNDAVTAFKAFADPADLDRIDELGNNELALRILSKVAKEMKEPGGIPPDAGASGTDDIQSILRSPAYLDPKHADHKATAEKVRKYYEKVHGTEAVR